MARGNFSLSRTLNGPDETCARPLSFVAPTYSSGGAGRVRSQGLRRSSMSGVSSRAPANDVARQNGSSAAAKARASSAGKGRGR